MSTPSNVSGEQVRTLAWLIKHNRCTPIIGDQFFLATVFGHDGLAQTWATQVGCPLQGKLSLATVAQFVCVASHWRPGETKMRYVEFLKDELLRRESQRQGANQQRLESARGQKDRYSFTAFALDQLHVPRLDPQQDHSPLLRLASIDFPAYVTTSPHLFLERALEAVDKAPQPLAYFGHTDPGPGRDSYLLDREVTLGDPRRPVVYHLFGVDEDESSLVLWEDDYLRYLITIYDDFKSNEIVPSHLRDAIARKNLLLIGYDFEGWDLRVLLNGLLRDTSKKDYHDVAIQIDPTSAAAVSDAENYRRYVESYFEVVNINVILQDPDAFIEELFNAL